MAVQVAIRGPVLALRQQLDDQSEKLRETSSTNAALRARIARFERQENVLHDSLLAAEEALGSSQCQGSNLHQQVAALRAKAEAATASQRQTDTENHKLRKDLADQIRAREEMLCTIKKAKESLARESADCIELRAALAAEKRRVRAVSVTSQRSVHVCHLQANTQAKADDATITELRKLLTKQQIMNQELLSTVSHREHHITLLQKVGLTQAFCG